MARGDEDCRECGGMTTYTEYGGVAECDDCGAQYEVELDGDMDEWGRSYGFYWIKKMVRPPTHTPEG